MEVVIHQYKKIPNLTFKITKNAAYVDCGSVSLQQELQLTV